jgi:hypothetical protein
MMRDAMLLITVLLIAAPAMAQPAPLPKPIPIMPGVVRGRITAADTGRPLRRARVTLTPQTTQAERPRLTVSTNAQGVFEMRDVPPGSYYVAAGRAGYIELQYGQRRPRTRGTAIELNSGDTRERVDIALPRGAVMAGRVLDELGAPYPGVTVMAMETRYTFGRLDYVPAGFAVSDDIGEYRLSGLQPGTYVVMAMSPETWRNEKKETLGYALTYYPGGPVGSTQRITLAVSQDRNDLDIHMAASRTVRVRGRVQRPTGEPLPSEAVSLARSVSEGAILATGGISTRTGGDGTFEFTNVAPATYLLRAGGGGGSASMPLVVSDADINDLLLVPRTGSTVTGSIITEEGGTPPFSASGIRINLLAPLGNVLPTVRVPAVDNDWTFRLANLGGPFLFRVQGLPEAWMLDAVRLGEIDITDVPYDVPTGGREITDLQIVITKKVGNLSGSVAAADGSPAPDATVVVFSEDPALWIGGSRFVKSARLTAEGTFTITGLPAGTYLAVARDFLIDGQWENKEFLESSRADAVRVTLSPGDAATIALKVPPR